MSWIPPDVFERTEKEDHRNDPALAVNELSDLWPTETPLNQDPTLAVGALANFFPEQEADAPEREADTIDYFAADDAVIAAPVEAPLDDDDLFDSDRVFESGAVVQSDIQRAATEFQLFAEKFHTFASDCQQRVTGS